MSRFAKAGLVIETSLPREAAALRSQGFVEVKPVVQSAAQVVVVDAAPAGPVAKPGDKSRK